MTIQECADLYRVSTKTVRRWIADGHLAAERLPGNRLIRIDTASTANLTKPVGNANPKPRRGMSGYLIFRKPKVVSPPPSTSPSPSRFIVITDFFAEDES
jgi:excisionase family DNA binding protein